MKSKNRVLSFILSAIMIFSFTSAVSLADTSKALQQTIGKSSDGTNLEQDSGGQQGDDLQIDDEQQAEITNQTTVRPRMTQLDVEGTKISKTLKTEFSVEKAVSANPFISTGVGELPPTFTLGESRLAENNPPVAGLEPVILNEETIKDGQITTSTIVAFLWYFDGQSFTYDPDGDEMTPYLFGMPMGYVYMLSDELYEGFAIQVPDPGHYEFSFFVQDSKGAISNIISYALDYLPVDDYEVIEDQLDTVNKSKTYSVTVDYSKSSAYAFCLTRTSLPGMSMNIYKDGKFVKGTNVDDANKSTTTHGKNWVTVTQPSGSEAINTYEVTVALTSNSTDSDSASFVIAVGPDSIKELMMSGPKNSVPLTRYDDRFDSTTKMQNRYISRYSPSQYSTYLTFSPSKNDTLTFLSDDPGAHFRIWNLDQTSLIIDSGKTTECDRENPYTMDWKNCQKLYFNTDGSEHLLEIYSTSGSTSFNTENFRVTIGDPIMVSRKHTTRISNVSLNTSSYSTYGVYAYDVPKTASVTVVDIRFDGFMPSDINPKWYVKKDSEYSFNQSNIFAGHSYPYTPGSPVNMSAMGGWQYRLKSAWTNLTGEAALQITYMFELGD